MTSDLCGIAAGDPVAAEKCSAASPILAVCGTAGPHSADLQVAVELGLRDEQASARPLFYDDQRSERRAQELAREIASNGMSIGVQI